MCVIEENQLRFGSRPIYVQIVGLTKGADSDRGRAASSSPTNGCSCTKITHILLVLMELTPNSRYADQELE